MNPQCPKCGSYKTIPYNNMIIGGAVLCFIIGLIILPLGIILIPVGFVLLIMGIIQKISGNPKMYCKECKKSFIEKEIVDINGDSIEALQAKLDQLKKAKGN